MSYGEVFWRRFDQAGGKTSDQVTKTDGEGESEQIEKEDVFIQIEEGTVKMD